MYKNLMKMILQLLIAASSGLIVVEPVTNIARAVQRVQYKEATAAFQEAEAILGANLLSMEGDIPLVNDFRRHYAVIAHVIMFQAFTNSGCEGQPYYNVYQEYLNTSIPEALNNPEMVIGEFKKLLNKVNKDTKKLIDLTNACVLEDSVCNNFIYQVQQNTVEFDYPAELLRSAGYFASKLNKLNSSFEAVSKNLEAVQYVITNPHALEEIVGSLTMLIDRSIDPFDCV